MAYWEPGGPRDKRFDNSGGSKIPLTSQQTVGTKPGYKQPKQSTGGGRVPPYSKGQTKKL